MIKLKICIIDGIKVEYTLASVYPKNVAIMHYSGKRKFVHIGEGYEVYTSKNNLIRYKKIHQFFIDPKKIKIIRKFKMEKLKINSIKKRGNK